MNFKAPELNEDLDFKTIDRRSLSFFVNYFVLKCVSKIWTRKHFRFRPWSRIELITNLHLHELEQLYVNFYTRTGQN